jgi:hypothetical protein
MDEQKSGPKENRPASIFELLSALLLGCIIGLILTAILMAAMK